VVTVEIPPLRRRRSDLPALVAHALEQARAKHPTSPVRRVSPEAFERLAAHAWPGNVRELANVVERAVLFGSDAEAGEEAFRASLTTASGAASEFTTPIVSLQEMNRRYARWAADQLGGRRVVTAEKLEIDRKTLAKLLGETGRG
jgi:DNA-binding NtrC family response regulator